MPKCKGSGKLVYLSSIGYSLSWDNPLRKQHGIINHGPIVLAHFDMDC